LCGIAGVFAYKNPIEEKERGILARISHSMEARGPDGSGVWVEDHGKVGLLHRRLSVIDVSENSNQPLWSACGRYVIVFNGEIYNYKSLRNLEALRGYKFRTASDTEVILGLYASMGIEAFSLLRGMFAFAIWDSELERLIIARDQFGIKPLYFANVSGRFWFASQVKPLLNVIGQICYESAGYVGYQIYGYIVEPWTLYKGILSLPSGAIQIFQEKDGALCRQQLPVETNFNEKVSSLGPLSSLRDQLLDTVSAHLTSDVPIGFFLSAGIDSSTLIGLASEVSSNLNTVTMGFTEYKGHHGDETQIAERLAVKYKTNHETVWIERDEFLHLQDEYFKSMDQPTIDGLNTWLISMVMKRRGFKVAVSGVGGDEFFGGYPSFRQMPYLHYLSRQPIPLSGIGVKIRQLLAPIIKKISNEKYAGIIEYSSTWEKIYMLRRALQMPWQVINNSDQKASRVSQEFIEEGLIKILADMNLDDFYKDFDSEFSVISRLESGHYMKNQLLRDADWASMAHSVELRVPLVDKKLVNFLAEQRSGGKIYSKRDLAGSVNPSLPIEIINRRKTGFTVPVKEWMGTQERGLIGWQKYVLEKYILNRPGFDGGSNF
jgi:asparagine synthase (glutamine-hydrolysing)